MKKRLDVLVFERGLTDSRERAKTSIMAGLVFVNGQKETSPGRSISDDAEIVIHGNNLPYVSRGGFKLEKALKVFPVVVQNKICLDCGASTGGFTDVLLQNGARKVYAVDVGYGQLAWKLRNDPRVVCMERTNIRYVSKTDITESVSLAVSDVSFISLRLVLPVLYDLMTPTGDLICLIKPQFEAGRESVGKHGVVRDSAVHEKVLSEFIQYASNAGFSINGLDYSPIRGPEGNIEYLAWLGKDIVESHANISFDLHRLVYDSHHAFSEEG